jgi:hypothetical protein
MVPYICCNPTTKSWGCLTFNAIVNTKLLEYLKFVELTIVVILGNVEDGRTFSTINLIKFKFCNYLTIHLNLVFKMYAQEFYKFRTFCFYKLNQFKKRGRKNYIIESNRWPLANTLVWMRIVGFVPTFLGINV